MCGHRAYIAPEPDNQNQPQLRQAIAVGAGNRFTVQIGVFGCCEENARSAAPIWSAKGLRIFRRSIRMVMATFS